MGSWTDGILRALRGEPTERQGYAGDQQTSDGLRELLDFERGRAARSILAARAGRDRWAARAAGRKATIRRVVSARDAWHKCWGDELKRREEVERKHRAQEAIFLGKLQKAREPLEAELAELKRQRGQRVEELEDQVSATESTLTLVREREGGCLAELDRVRGERDSFKQSFGALREAISVCHGVSARVSYALNAPEADLDGTILPIDELSYTPAYGGSKSWANQDEPSPGPEPDEPAGLVQCEARGECDDLCSHKNPHIHRTSCGKPYCYQTGRIAHCHAPPGDAVHQKAPDDPPAPSPYEEFKAKVEAAGLTARDCGNRWQICTTGNPSLALVNFWPHESVSRMQQLQPNVGCMEECTAAGAVNVAVAVNANLPAARKPS